MEVTKREVEGLGARAIHACGAEEDEKEKKERKIPVFCFMLLDTHCLSHLELM